MKTEENYNLIRNIIDKGNVVALTGAGVSKESGIPTFREKGGLWDRYDPSIYGSIVGLSSLFLFKPHRIRDFIVDIYEGIISATPNPAHFALAKLEEEGKITCIVTQNIDNLHQEAGSKRVYELHGNIYVERCIRCGKRHKRSKEEIKGILDFLKSARRYEILSKILPKCECGGRKRPDVVLFGESLPQEEFEEAYNEVRNCKSLLLVGTSGVVYPAASLPYLAKEVGATIIEISPEPTALSSLADHTIIGKAGDILPKLLERK
ncbi:MAG: NAD-dependent deacylase [candidate division WOR-3 bacterium]|nr:NAD-dependent deacylase [candidate division WOR-3 bacterium]